MGLMHADYYETVRDYLHPDIHDFINHYRCGNLIDLPPFHGCNQMEPENLCTNWVNNVLLQLGNAIGET